MTDLDQQVAHFKRAAAAFDVAYDALEDAARPLNAAAHAFLKAAGRYKRYGSYPSLMPRRYDTACDAISDDSLRFTIEDRDGDAFMVGISLADLAKDPVEVAAQTSIEKEQREREEALRNLARAERRAKELGAF